MTGIRYFEHSVLGVVVLSGSEGTGLTRLEFASHIPDKQPLSSDPFLEDIELRLKLYLAGQRVDFSTIPLAPHGSRFQQAVWEALCRIPFGETRSYKWVAQQLNMPNASRAIGQANGRNPIPIIIPCHRVIQHDGTLGGYTGGLKIKSFLLGLERPRQLQLAVNGTLLNPQDRALTLL